MVFLSFCCGSAFPPKRCLRSLLGFILPAIKQIRSDAMATTRLRDVATLDAFLNDLPLLFRGSIYAWFGEYLASHGYIVAMVYHFRANTYDSSALYVRNRIWQRPRDLSKDISFLLQDKKWGVHIDPDRIGVVDGPL